MKVAYSDRFNGLAILVVCDYNRDDLTATISEIQLAGRDIKVAIGRSSPLEFARIRNECYARCEETIEDMRNEYVNNAAKALRERS